MDNAHTITASKRKNLAFSTTMETLGGSEQKRHTTESCPREHKATGTPQTIRKIGRKIAQVCILISACIIYILLFRTFCLSLSCSKFFECSDTTSSKELSSRSPSALPSPFPFDAPTAFGFSLPVSNKRNQSNVTNNQSASISLGR